MLLEHCDPSLEARSVTFRKFGKNCLISEQCTFESLVLTVTPESADASLDSAFRSVCVCVCMCVKESLCISRCHKAQNPALRGKNFL